MVGQVVDHTVGTSAGPSHVIEFQLSSRMPLTVSEDIPSSFGTTFLIFYASRDVNGRMWCPDCRDVEEHVKETFESSPQTGLIIYVGNKPTWKSPDNRFRQSHNISSIPTIVRLDNGKETARLIEGEILEPGKLEQLIHQPVHPVQEEQT